MQQEPTGYCGIIACSSCRSSSQWSGPTRIIGITCRISDSYYVRTERPTLGWIDIEHSPRKDNKPLDALSRLPDPHSLSPGEPDLKKMVSPSRPRPPEIPGGHSPTLPAIHTPSLFKEVYISQIEDPDLERDIHR